jgi:HAD superfamily hydrolase (TIGR01490 family)
MHLNEESSQRGPQAATPTDLAARRLALFDLDYTLLPIDSDYEWARFLVRAGVVDGAEYEQRNDEFFRQYHAGTLDIDEFLAFQLAPLGEHPPETLERWHDQFMDEVIQPAIRDGALELVRTHRDRGDLCAIVTATNEFVTAPIARAFGIEHLIATGVERVDGRYTGRPRGTPSFREGKILRTREWLEAMGRDLADFGESWFYSDSSNDVPLLELVTNPVATNPDERLAALAGERGWQVLRLFE